MDKQLTWRECQHHHGVLTPDFPISSARLSLLEHAMVMKQRT